MVTNKPIFTLLFFSIFTLSACTNYYCNNLKTAILDQCPYRKENCIISLNEAFSIEWDNLFIFDSMLYPDEVSSSLGFDCKCDIVPEGEKLIFFTKKGKLVKKMFSECYNITFVKMKTNGVIKLERNSTFILKDKTINGNIHYYLHNN